MTTTTNKTILSEVEAPQISHPVIHTVAQVQGEHKICADRSAPEENVSLFKKYMFPSFIKKMEKRCLKSKQASVPDDHIIFVRNKALNEEVFGKYELQSDSLTIKLSVETEYLIKLTENILTFIRLLMKANSAEDYILAIAVFAQCRSDKSLSSILMDQWDRIMSLTLQSEEKENRFSQFRNLLDKYDSIKKLPIFVKLHRFMMYCIGTSLFEKLGVPFKLERFVHVEKAAVKKEFHMGPDFIHCVLDTVTYMSGIGYQCMVTGSFSPILHHESTYEQWIVEGEKLRTQSRYISNPEPHGFTVFEFLSNLNNNIETGKNIVKYLPSKDASASIIRKILADLELIKADCLTKRLAQQERKAPFAVLVHGGSSVAKSQFTKLLFYHYGKMFNLPIGDEYKYTRNAFDQYWTNFNTSQWCLQLDDIAYLHPNSSQGCDPSLTEMLQVVNNVPYVPTQADLSDKGKTPVRAKFVIATSNTDTLNANTYFACPLAVQRRLPYVLSIEPKPEYRRDGGPMIDPSKIPVSREGEYPDLWRITVKKVVPNDKPSLHMGQTAALKEIGIHENVFSFLTWFNSIAQEAEGFQEQALKCDRDMEKAVLCCHHLPQSQCPDCDVALQSSELIIRVDTPWTQAMEERFRPNSENAEESDSYHDTPHRYTMRHILRQIAQMSVLDRIIVLWYTFVLWLTQRGGIWAFMVGMFYGKWAMLIIACKFMHIPEMRKILVYLIGHGVYRKIRNERVVRFCAAIVTAVTIIKACKYMFGMTQSFSKQSLQGETQERGRVPDAKNDKAENVWYKDQFECTPFDVTPSTLSKANWSMDEVVKYISPNLAAFFLRARSESTILERKGKIFCIGGHTYVCNNHCVPFDAFEISLTFQSSKDGVTQNFTTLVTPAQIQRYPKDDIVVIQLLSIPPRKDIRDLFVKDTYRGNFDGQFVARHKDGSLDRRNFYNPIWNDQVNFVDPEKNARISTRMWKYTLDKPTEEGDCGSLIVSLTSMGPIILGMHTIGGGSNKSFAVSVTQDFLNTLTMPIFSEQAPTLKIGDYEQHLIDLDKKATVRYIEQGTLQVFGSLGGFRGKLKSRVGPSYLKECALQAGYKCNTGAPIMNSYLPWRKALLDIARPVSHIDLTLLNHCAEEFTKDILAGLTPDKLSELHVYDLNTAINGRPGLAFVDKMPRNTSAGFPFRKSKKYFMTKLEPFDDYQHPVAVTAEIESECDKIIRDYEKCKLYSPVFTASLKDEPTSFKKIKEGKTRVFCGAPLAWSLVVRMHFLCIIRLIQSNRFLFESGPGTIAQSKEWDDLYRHITQFGVHRIIAGDYGKFDKRMLSAVILAAFNVLSNILRAAGWTTEMLRVVHGIAEDTAFPVLDFRGELIRCYGSNPSGHPLTVIINGLVNCLYVRYCYATTHPKHTCSDFKKYVALMTYGDDLIMGVSEECTWFNHTTMQKTLADIDIEFTMADKEAKSVPFIHIDNATFLRRSWRYEPELDLYVCPIEHDSIDKMLTMCVASKTVSAQVQAVYVLETATREYFWYGREEFEKRRTMFYEWINLLSLEKYMEHDLPTWNQLVAEFKHNSAIRA